MLAAIIAVILAGNISSVLTVPLDVVVEKVWTTEEVKQLAITKAKKYGLHKKRFLATLECENGFRAKGQSEHYYKGVREDSWGVAQIHLPAHPTITREMAEDPEIALEFMAQKWSNDEASLWSCYTMLFK